MKQTHMDTGQTAHLCRSLALMLHAGADLADSLHLLAQEWEQPHGQLLTQLGQAMDRGETLSRAMEESTAFPRFVCAMVRTGEATGRLEYALDALADHCEERLRTRNRLRDAVVYPGMVLGMTVLVCGVLVVQVLPVFDRVYATLGTRLTGFAAYLLHLGQYGKAAGPWFWIAAGTLLAACLCPPLRQKAVSLYQTRFGDRGAAHRFHNAHFLRGLAMGIGSGLSQEEALELACGMQDVPGAKERCRKCEQEVRSGAGLDAALAHAGILKPADRQLLNMGLRGGNADKVLQLLADRAEEAAQAALDRKISRIEPAMVLTGAALAGAVLLSAMLPLMDLLASMR